MRMCVGTLKAAGAEVAAGGRRVRFSRALVLESMGRAPRNSLSTRETPARPDVAATTSISGLSQARPTCLRLLRSRTQAKKILKDSCNLVRLCQEAEHRTSPFRCRWSPPICRRPRVASTRRGGWRSSGGLWHPCGSASGVADAVDVICCSRAVSIARELKRRSLSIVDSSSPLRLDVGAVLRLDGDDRRPSGGDDERLRALRSDVAGDDRRRMVLQIAEALAGLRHPDRGTRAPCRVWRRASSVDVDAARQPSARRYVRAARSPGGQLARRFQLPTRSSNACAADAVDAQAACGWECGSQGAGHGTRR